MVKDSNTRVDITLPKVIVDKLNSYRESYGFSMSQLLHVIVVDYLERKENR